MSAGRQAAVHEQEDRRTVTAPSQGNDRGTERTDGEDGFGTADERVGDGFGDGADG